MQRAAAPCTWSSSFTGSDMAATMKHTEQQLSGSTESSSDGAHGSAVLWEQINQLHWSTCSSCILEAWLLHVLQWSCCSWCTGKELLCVKALCVHRMQLLYNPYALLPRFVLWREALSQKYDWHIYMHAVKTTNRSWPVQGCTMVVLNFQDL